MSKGSRKRTAAQRKLEEARQQQKARQTRIRLLAGGAVVVVVAAITVVVVVLASGGTSTKAGVNHTTAGHGMAQGATVDGIQCQSNEQAVYHIHAHLAIFDNGTQQAVPAGIGVPGPQQVQQGFVESGKCFYWLHTHDGSGIIHVESPTQKVYTLGQFFDIWGQPLSSGQVGSAKGHVIAYVNGKQVPGDPAAIKLTPHKVIQLDVGSNVSPKPYTFPQGV